MSPFSLASHPLDAFSSFLYTSLCRNGSIICMCCFVHCNLVHLKFSHAQYVESFHIHSTLEVFTSTHTHTQMEISLELRCQTDQNISNIMTGLLCLLTVKGRCKSRNEAWAVFLEVFRLGNATSIRDTAIFSSNC